MFVDQTIHTMRKLVLNTMAPGVVSVMVGAKKFVFPKACIGVHRGNKHTFRLLQKLRKGALGRATDVQDFFFEALDPKLRNQYAKVYQAIDELDCWPTRKDEIFAFRTM
jgi:hypothetical protein